MGELDLYLFRTALIFAAFEVIAFIVFLIIRKTLGGKDIGGKLWLEFVKGLLERLVLLTGMILQFPQVLIFFGALKIGTRLSAERSDKGSNYFIIGNLTSVLFAFATYTTLVYLTREPI